MERGKLAVQLHAEKDYNCAQSVLVAFGEETELDEIAALAATDGLGGGFRCGEICGALSGAVIAAGLICAKQGEHPVRSPKIKEMTNKLTEAFAKEEGCVRCHDLLESTAPEKLCNKYIEDAANMLEDIIKGEK